MPTQSDYFVLLTSYDEGAFSATFDGNLFHRTFEMKLGVPCRQNWPANPVLLNTDPEIFATGPRLHDLVGNTMGWLIASAPLRAIISRHCASEEIEWLETALETEPKKKKRPAVRVDGWAVGNPLGARPAVDRERSDVEMDTVIKDQVKSVRRLVLAPDLAEGGPALFRAADMRRFLFVRSDLAAEIRAAKMTGGVLVPSSEFRTSASGSPVMPA